MYKLTKTKSIIRLSDGAFIPNDPRNSGRREYEMWLSEGNTPLPIDDESPQEIFAEIEREIAKHMDEVAQTKRYDNRDSCRLYAGYINKYQAEAIAYGQWVASCWDVSNQAQADIIAGTRTIPTPTEAIAELPTMIWPV